MASPEQFSEGADLKRISKSLGEKYVPIDGSEIKIVSGNTLGKRLKKLYMSGSESEEGAKAAAIEMCSRMALSAESKGIRGFSVSYVQEGDKFKFLSGHKVEVTYSPRDGGAKRKVKLDLKNPEHHKKVEETRAAVEGGRPDIVGTALSRRSLDMTARILGYNWNSKKEKAAFLKKVSDLEAPSYNGEGPRNSAICKFLEEKYNANKKGFFASMAKESVSGGASAAAPAVKPDEIIAAPAVKPAEIIAAPREVAPDESEEVLIRERYKDATKFLGTQILDLLGSDFQLHYDTDEQSFLIAKITGEHSYEGLARITAASITRSSSFDDPKEAIEHGAVSYTLEIKSGDVWVQVVDEVFNHPQMIAEVRDRLYKQPVVSEEESKELTSE
jgi:hypothetical protein